MYFGYYASPVEILGGEKVEGIRMERTKVEDGSCIPTGETFDVDCGMVVTCIGSRAEPIEGLPFDDKKGIVAHTDGRVRDGVYAVGWVKRGATGTIGTNKNDSLAVVDLMVAEFYGDTKEGPDAFDRLAVSRGLRVVSYPEWQIINSLEEQAAAPEAPRRKFITPSDMLAALDKAQAAE